MEIPSSYAAGSTPGFLPATVDDGPQGTRDAGKCALISQWPYHPVAMPNDVEFMQQALQLARTAGQLGEVPVGAVLTLDDSIIATGTNQPIARHDATAHAEIEVLRAGGKTLGSYRLTDTVLYVTLEPCAMCAAAMVHARVRRVVFGAWDPRAGAAGSMLNLFRLAGLNHRVDVFGGVLQEECGALLDHFFAGRRR